MDRALRQVIARSGFPFLTSLNFFRFFFNESCCSFYCDQSEYSHLLLLNEIGERDVFAAQSRAYVALKKRRKAELRTRVELVRINNLIFNCQGKNQENGSTTPDVSLDFG